MITLAFLDGLEIYNSSIEAAIIILISLMILNVTLGYILDTTYELIENHIKYANFIKRSNKSYLLLIAVCSIGFVTTTTIIILVVTLKLLLSKERFDEVHECNKCGYYFRLNQVNYVNVSKLIIEKNIVFKNTFLSNDFKEAGEYFNENNYISCPKCNHLSNEFKYHEKLDKHDINGTEKTTFEKYLEIYKDKVDAYKYLYSYIKENEENTKRIKKEEKEKKVEKEKIDLMKEKQEKEEKKNKELYEKEKENIEIKKMIEVINSRQ